MSRHGRQSSTVTARHGSIPCDEMTSYHWLTHSLFYLLVAISGLGCGQAEEDPPPLAPIMDLTHESGPVVATIETSGGEIPIYLSRLLAYAENHPDQSVERSLADLVDFEILAQAAYTAGVHKYSEVEYKRNQVMVRRFLKGSFEPERTVDTIPEKIIRKMYADRKKLYVHNELRDIDQIVVAEKTPDGAPTKAQRPTSSTLDVQARALAQRIYDELQASPPSDRVAFRRRVVDYTEEAENLGLLVWFEATGLFCQTGEFIKPRKFIDDFVNSVFAYDAPKVIIPPFATQFGYHIVRLDGVLPAKNIPYEEAEPKLRRAYHFKFLNEELRELGDKLAADYPGINEGKGVKKLQNPTPLGALSVYE